MMVWYDIVFRLVIAIIVGACIGMERQWRHRMAGLRTNALITWYLYNRKGVMILLLHDTFYINLFSNFC